MADLADRAVFEKKLAQAIGDRLNGSFKALLDYLGDPPSLDNVPADFWDEHGADLADVIQPVLQQVHAASGQAVASGLSVETTNKVDWKLANRAAATWAKQYTYELVKDLTDNTQKQVRDVISRFFTDQLTMGDLRDALEGSFSPVRAALIASTEVTRASVQGELNTVNEIEDQTDMKLIPTWATSEDDHVCDICDPRDGTTPEDGDWADDYPPAHPACRCWVNWSPEGWA